MNTDRPAYQTIEPPPALVAHDVSEYRVSPYRWPDSTITWSFADLEIPGDVRNGHIGSAFLRDGSDGMRGIVRDAFASWERVCGVDFVEVSDSIDTDVRIGWTSAALSDGPGGTLAFFAPWTWAGTNTLSSGVIAVDHADSGVPLDDLYDTVLHEVGHALGLDHSNVANVVMSGGLYSGDGPTPYWRGVPGRDPLQADDIAGAVALWGQPEGARRGTSGNDTLFGTQGPDRIDGGAGNDRINGLRGNDTLIGGSGSDTLIGGFNLARDGAHESTGGRNVFIGGAGNDFMTAGIAGIGLQNWSPAPGSDTFVFAPGHGHDVVIGNWGDTVGREYHGAPEKIDLSAFGSRAPTWGEVEAHLSEIYASAQGISARSVRLDLSDFGGGSITFWNEFRHNIDASDFIGLRDPRSAGPTAFADTLRGTAADDTIDGLGGNDAILGGAGDDLLYGGAGNDKLWGGSGDDALSGGDGNDLIYGGFGDDRVWGGDGRDIVLAGEGADSVRGDAGDDKLFGGGGNDTLTGDEGRDFVAGGAGNDQLYGGAGKDYLAGESGNDTLLGGAEREMLAGGTGNDLLYGGSEGDTFFGQAGADTFVFAGGTNWVMDFESGTDRLSGTGYATSAEVRGAATQVGAHLHIELDGGGDLYLAWTTLGELAGQELV